MPVKVPLPGVSQEEHARRRARVLDAIDGGIMILPAGTAPVYSNDSEYRFRSHSDFFYLSGYPEEEAVLVLRPGAEHPYTLFVRARDPEAEVWTGRRFGPEGAVREFGADAAFVIDELPGKLADMIDGCTTLYLAPFENPALDSAVQSALGALRGKERFGRIAPDTIIRPAALLHEMRLFKSPEELDVLRRAAEISVQGHLAAIGMTRPGVLESQIQGVVESTFRIEGATGPGYATIVGAGDNACILHYIENNMEVGDGDLVLIDAGAEYGGYTGDITRTFPANGTFTGAQRDLYAIVLDALERGIAMSKPGETIDGIHEMTFRRLSEGLIELGCLKGTVDEVLEKESFKKYYMHRTSHWLGMDVHDVGHYRAENACRPLEPGMVFTIEPGLYIPVGDEDAPAELRGQAVRIEDDVVVTETGCENLTRGVPVDPDALAALVGKKAGQKERE